MLFSYILTYYANFFWWPVYHISNFMYIIKPITDICIYSYKSVSYELGIGIDWAQMLDLYFWGGKLGF